jgi:hypothetical protein
MASRFTGTASSSFRRTRHFGRGGWLSALTCNADMSVNDAGRSLMKAAMRQLQMSAHHREPFDTLRAGPARSDA